MNPLLAILLVLSALIILLAAYVGWRAYRLYVVVRKLKKPLEKAGREIEHSGGNGDG